MNKTGIKNETANDPVRERVRQWIIARTEIADTVLQETMLVQNGAYHGRRFASGDFEAIHWCCENRLDFYDASGSRIETVNLPVEAPAELRRAA